MNIATHTNMVNAIMQFGKISLQQNWFSF